MVGAVVAFSGLGAFPETNRKATMLTEVHGQLHRHKTRASY
jgi:hypothetical protein